MAEPSFRCQARAFCLGLFLVGSPRAGKCDYLIITDSMFSAQAQRLADLRHSLTPNVAKQPCIAKMADIYRQYPPTGPKWKSVQAFLKTAYQLNQPDLAHVVLLGDASLDPASSLDHVPTFTEQIQSLQHFSPDTVFHDTFSSDDAYADFFDSLNVDSLPSQAFAIGRIPADSPLQADAYLDKVEAYEAHYAYGPGAFTYGFLNDDDLQMGSFEGLDPIRNMPEENQEIWDSLAVKPFVRRMLSIEFPIQPTNTKPAAEDSTLGLFNAAPARIYFVGHGSPNQLTDENIFHVPGDLARLRPKTLQPIVSMLACTTARFADPDSQSMGEQMLFHPHGAVAFLGGTIPTFPDPNNRLFIHWNRLASAGGTLGSTFAKAKDSVWDYRNSAAYALLGDPALTLRVPAFDLVPAVGSGAGRLVLQNAGAAGDSAYFQLVRLDSIPFNFVISPLNTYLKDRLYPREVLVAEGRASLSAGGTVTFMFPTIGDPRAMALKVMTWNSRGMRYGHFPLESLGVLALRPFGKPSIQPVGWHLALQNNRLVLVGSGRRLGLDGKAIR